ncbi:DUF2169 domain-containing protein [Agrobacterium sp. lyk4-40-TYG-31]|uniref:DUF2169 family type VI secretion system accessory protein n=1 Tax=Agrobacterium sp. lyk4-40-TYG-31 TaxID=3040276 RepID=UPI00254C265C|nr:DUF2169 domain-containing protein [Agrobacterium sp. lyk4-40-TYG-31]
MPELVNHTPYPNFRYYSSDKAGVDFGVVIVKCTYEVGPSGRLLKAEEQAPMVFTDMCHGEVNRTSLWHPSDLVPLKPATDLIVNGVARAPGSEPLPSWTCGVRIEDDGNVRLEKILRVTGPREWRPIWKRRLSESEKQEWQLHRRYFDRWELSEPTSITELPLHYEYAFGGEVPQGQDTDGKAVFDTDHRNPLGLGKIDPACTDHSAPIPAPQIESINEPVSDPYQDMMPQSLGPIPPAWLPRRPLGGTYDQNWKDNIWPAWPPDYDFAYHNSAHPDLILDPYLKGTETIQLTGLSAASETFHLRLPGEKLIVDFVDSDRRLIRQNMVLDTLNLDISARSVREWRVFVSWRTRFQPGLYDSAVIQRVLPNHSAENVRDTIRERKVS